MRHDRALNAPRIRIGKLFARNMQFLQSATPTSLVLLGCCRVYIRCDLGSGMDFGINKLLSRRHQYGWLVASFLFGITCWLTFIVFFRGSAVKVDQGISSGQSQIEDEVDASIPRPTLSPADVVTLQVNSIRDAIVDPTKLKVCYSLASPENRKHTGPLRRFAEIVMLPPYDRLAKCVDWQVGGAVIENDLAAVLVSTISQDGGVSGFRFILQRHDSSMRNCWLTEGVQCLAEESMDGSRGTQNESNRKLE